MQLGQGYAKALSRYTEQKNNFLNYLQMQISTEQLAAISELGMSIDVVPQGDSVNKIIEQLQQIISDNPDITNIRRELSQMYKDKEITKEEVNKLIEQKMEEMFSPLWFQTQVMSKLGSIEGKEISRIDDSALAGRIKMLFHMAMRHNSPLTPSNFTKSQLEGVLYEHAVVDGLRQYFSTIDDLSKILDITPEGAKGTRSDIKIKFNEEYFAKHIQGETSQREFNIQVKNTDLEEFLSSKSHTDTLRVGGGQAVFGQELLAQNPHPSVEYSMYFLSKRDNVLRAIGEDVILYGYANGKLKFTADLINTLHYQKHYNLAMPKIASKSKSMYIEWIRSKT